MSMVPLFRLIIVKIAMQIICVLSVVTVVAVFVIVLQMASFIYGSILDYLFWRLLIVISISSIILIWMMNDCRLFNVPVTFIIM